MDTFKTIQPLRNDINRLHKKELDKLEKVEELEEKDPNILSVSTIRYYHNYMNKIDYDIQKRFDIYFRNNILTLDLYNHYKQINKDYRNTLFNNNYYRHFLRLTSLDNLNKSLSNNDYEFLKKYTNTIKNTYLQILDPLNQYINSDDVNKEINSCLSLCDESLKKLREENHIKQSIIIKESLELKKDKNII